MVVAVSLNQSIFVLHKMLLPYLVLTLFVLKFCAAVAATGDMSVTKPIPKFPAILVFGDSTMDAGNNNYIITPAKSNHPPYGVDFPNHVPTGRFSNGRLVPDLLASMMGLKETIPPYLQPDLSDDEIFTGVSFASAGSGYDDLTTLLSNVIPVSTQLSYFEDYIQRLEGIANRTEAARILRRALVIISAGTNDFIFNFYDIVTRRIQFTIDEYQDFLQNKLHDLIKEVYRLGCRKIVVSGLPPIGCIPIQITAKSPIFRHCIHRQNADSVTYNKKLEKLLPRIEADLPGSKILYVDTYNSLTDMISNPKQYGFEETSRGCCGTGLVEAGPLCSPLSPVCQNSSEYLFWDSVHPTESTYRILVSSLTLRLSELA
ncbi:GDSL esterase/lipase At2g31550-like [Andrographis paniculata]|uniref:GDSL esterase/lipase At2g31550-like n=1 Tax=Andrographis paniculata TaxID=175694 RepID=UPI0021E7E035|nr:GDSL esterase/lipase At2g31550-like [Andrographis paniculata]